MNDKELLRATGAASANPEVMDELLAKAPEGYNPNAYEPFAVTADLAIFTVADDTLKLLLIQRGAEPHKGAWALPGGFLEPHESAEEAAVRELEEETGLRACVTTVSNGTSANGKGVWLEQLKTYSTAKRDPRMRVVSVAFVALSADVSGAIAGSDADDVAWVPVDDVLAGEVEVAFDHYQIIADARERVAAKLEYTTVATHFVGVTFTIADLWRVYGAVWGERPTLANFRRKVLSVPGFVVDTGAVDGSGGPGPKARLYRAGDGTAVQPALLRSE